MVYNLGENLFDRVSKQKNSLIMQFSQGDLTKKEFLIENFELIQNLNVKPFTIVDCAEKGFYNYQYYNTLAKYYRMEASEVKGNPKYHDIYREYLNESNYYYKQKDKTVSKVLKIVEFKNIEAYYIKVNSSYLKNKLIEIIFKDYDNTIFHTRSPWVIESLKNEGILSEQIKKSVIDSYINQKY